MASESVILYKLELRLTTSAEKDIDLLAALF